jgi:hypothetical protein
MSVQASINRPVASGVGVGPLGVALVAGAAFLAGIGIALGATSQLAPAAQPAVVRTVPAFDAPAFRLGEKASLSGQVQAFDAPAFRLGEKTVIAGTQSWTAPGFRLSEKGSLPASAWNAAAFRLSEKGQ